jgi:hypothetical protein
VFAGPRVHSFAAAWGVVAVIALAAPAAADAGITNGANYSVKDTSIEGGTPDQMGSWAAQFGELSGGDPRVVQAFNDASRAAAQGQIDRLKSVVNPGLAWSLKSSGRVTFRRIAVGQVITGTEFYGAVPTVEYSTVVIDSRTARPITIADLFTDEQAGLQRLSEQTKVMLGKTYGFDGGRQPDQPGNAPLAQNFANWIPTADGMEIDFAPYQFGARYTEKITVPWSALADVLAPDMQALAQG